LFEYLQLEVTIIRTALQFWGNTMGIKHFLSCAVMLLISQASWSQEATFHNYEVRAAVLPSMQSYYLTGSGYGVTNAFTSGNGLQGGFSYLRQHDAWSFDFRTLQTNMTAPAGITPSSVTTQFDRGVVSYQMMSTTEGVENTFQDNTPNGLVYELGVEYRGHKADVTKPNVFMPTTTTVGAHLGLSYNGGIDENFSYMGAFSLYVPLYMDEATAHTGYYRISANPDLGVDLIYKVNHFINFAIGIHAVYEQTWYADQANRGGANETETTTNIYAPVVLRFQF
jgi:hypothetical protein